MLEVMPSRFGLWFLLAGYFLVAAFLIIERILRKTASAKMLQRGNFDKGSTLLIGSAFGAGLLIPLVMNILDISFSPSILRRDFSASLQ